MAPHANGDVEVIGTSDTASAVVLDPILTKNPTTTYFTLDDVLPHRQKSAPMPPHVAAFGSADMFKSKGCYMKPKAKDFSHRISPESASRQPSSLKNAMKFLRPNMISLCGGLPLSDYFPFETVGARVAVAPGFTEQETRKSGVDISMSKHSVQEGNSVYDLSIAMNYGQSMGPPQLMRYMTEHTELVHNPKYSDWDTVVTTGNTTALDIALRLFCQRGDFALVEEYTFSSAVETMLPMGITPVGIPIDGDGILPEPLDAVLSTWDESLGPKPFVLYLIPTGQNPSGATQTLQRRKDIYAVAEKHDLFILEDDPYYFLQMEPYTPGKIHEVPVPFVPTTPADFLSKLLPSYLSLDISGRVMRMDSMSKVLAPGTRAGWITASKQICERFIRHQEVSSQNASGFTYAILFKLLDETWGHKGFLEWLMFLRGEYTRRRDIMVDACERYLPPSVARWKAPAAGMFHWIEIDSTMHPGVQKGTVKIADVEDRVFLAAVEANVLVAKGSWFLAEKENRVIIGNPMRKIEGANGHSNGIAEEKNTDLYFRMTFAAASQEQIVEAVKRFGDALRVEFGVEK